jgi:hypothetical protein
MTWIRANERLPEGHSLDYSWRLFPETRREDDPMYVNPNLKPMTVQEPSIDHMNKVIAEFMGITPLGGQFTEQEIEVLKYNSDWNQLMQVGKFCHDRMKELPNETVIAGFNTYWKILTAIQTWEIENAHKAIYDFITWYSTHKPIQQ